MAQRSPASHAHGGRRCIGCFWCLVCRQAGIFQEYCVFAAVMNWFWCLVTDFTRSTLPGPRPVRAAERRTFIFLFPNLAKNEASKTPRHGQIFHFWARP